MNYDAYVIGCGLTGGVIARAFADKGSKVLILEKRGHIAGNMYDERDKNGILIQRYGPHIFHTSKKGLYEYMLQFGEFMTYKLTCMVQMNDKVTPSPFNYQTIDDYFNNAAEIKEHIESAFPGQTQSTIVEMLESSDAVVKKYADYLFEYDYKLYTAKQWGIYPSEIDMSVLKRVPVRFSYDVGYFNDEYEAMPKSGYTSIIKNIVTHDNIKLELGVNACERFKIKNGSLLLDGNPVSVPVFYSGAIDELFEYKYGELPYRSLRFEYETINKDNYQNAPVVAYPQEPDFTRITEYKKLPVQNVPGVTAIAREYPLQAGKGAEPYYPILTKDNTEKYERYRKEAENVANLYVCGRLGDYKYYNMDEALERALKTCDRFIKK